MSRRGARPIFFVCAAVSEQGELLTKIVNATTSLDAKKLFQGEFGVNPKEIMGPFHKKQTQILEVTRELKFVKNDKSRRAIYHDWLVDAFLLSDPPEHAYLVFQKRIDDKKVTPPKGTVTVPVTDLRFVSNENKQNILEEDNG